MAKKEKTQFEREYVIPLRKGIKKIVRHKKTQRAMRDVIDFLKKHTKAAEVKVGMHLNEHIWKHGLKNPPAKVKVTVSFKDGVARAELFGKTYKEAVKAEKKKEPQNLKDKIEEKLGTGSTGDEKKEEPSKPEATAKEASPAEAPKKKSPAKKKQE